MHSTNAITKESLLAGKPALQTFDLVVLNNGYLYINRDNGHWIITSNDRSFAYRKINRFKSIRTLLDSEIIQPQEFMSLWKSGLLLLDNISSRSMNQLDYMQEEMLYVLRLTNACNLKCNYCYAAIDSKPQILSCDIATKLFQSATAHGEKATILFHGGEPLMEFKKLQELVSIGNNIASKNNSFIRFKIQSNGTLINKEVASFLKSENIAIGISIDGNNNEQNRNRLLRNGKHSTDLTLRGVNELRKQEVPVSLNIVVSSSNVQKLQSMVREFSLQGIREFYFSPIMPAGRARAQFADYAITPDLFLQGMKDVLKEIIDLHNSGIFAYAKNISYIILNMVTDQYYYMCQRAPCGAGSNVLSIDTNGEVYICDDFTGISEFRCGNVQFENIQQIRHNLKRNKFPTRVPDNIESCKTCHWKSICCSGCMSSAWFGKGTIEERTPWCSYYNAIIPYLFELFADGLDPYTLIPNSFIK